MGTMILISVVAIIVALVGSAVIWRLDVARADEIEHVEPLRSTTSPAVAAPVAARARTLPPSV